MEIGKVELSILAELQRAADAQRKQIAHNIGITESNLSKKIASLKAEGYIKRFTIDINYALLGYVTPAVTFIKLDIQSDDLIDRLVATAKSFPNCEEIATVAGQWDVLIRWLCRDNSEVISSVRKLLAEFSPSVHVETFFLAQVFDKPNDVMARFENERGERG